MLPLNASAHPDELQRHVCAAIEIARSHPDESRSHPDEYHTTSHREPRGTVLRGSRRCVKAALRDLSPVAVGVAGNRPLDAVPCVTGGMLGAVPRKLRGSLGLVPSLLEVALDLVERPVRMALARRRSFDIEPRSTAFQLRGLEEIGEHVARFRFVSWSASQGRAGPRTRLELCGRIGTEGLASRELACLDEPGAGTCW
jgi:hypothetical protein